MIEKNAHSLFFSEEKLLIRVPDQQVIFSVQEIYKNLFNSLVESDYFYLGEVDQKKLYAININATDIIGNHYNFVPVREALQIMNAELFKLICRSKQLLYWHRSSLYCGSCGLPTLLSQTEIAKICQRCQKIIYPTYSPAIIVLIERNDQILLARSSHFSKGVYSTLAGFVDPGESCEEAITREVFEEVGIQIKEIEYFGSQSWPFPNSFMLGFRAKYASGELCINLNEIEDAKWFSINELPILPSTTSIARHLIDSFVKSVI
jgi:NAD+ diphosphatase